MGYQMLNVRAFSSYDSITRLLVRNSTQRLDVVQASWKVMAHAQKQDIVFRRKWRVHLNRRRRQFSRLLAAEVFASHFNWPVMLDTPCSEVVWRVLATHSIRQFPSSLPSPCVTVCHHISTGVYVCYLLWSLSAPSRQLWSLTFQLVTAAFFHVPSNSLTYAAGEKSLNKLIVSQ
jgi:hypothetical protein